MPDLALALSLAQLLPQSAGPYAAVVLIGFAIGGAGHLWSSRLLILIGICLVVLGALALPLALDLTEGTPPQIEGRR